MLTEHVIGLAKAAQDNLAVLPILADALQEMGEDTLADAARDGIRKLGHNTLGKLADGTAVTATMFRRAVDRYNADAYRPKPYRFFIPSPWTLNDVDTFGDVLPNAVVAVMIARSDDEFPFTESAAVRQFSGNGRGGDPWGYDVYDDGSLRYWNNADTEAWTYATDFADKMASIIRDCRTAESWNELAEVDREFLSWAYGGDTNAAENCGFAVAETV